MSIQTNVRARPSRVYRLIDGDLCSAAVNRPLADQTYEVEQAAVVDAASTTRSFRVVVREGFIWLEE